MKNNIYEFRKYASELSVLYLEDDEMVRTETEDVFKLLFKSVITAENGIIGLELYKEIMFDIVITDLSMPIMNGIALINKIKEINPEQKIIAISAHNESERLIKAIQAGVNTFLQKPIAADEIISTLHRVCMDAYAQKLEIELVNDLVEMKEFWKEKFTALDGANNVSFRKDVDDSIKIENISFSEQKDTVTKKYFEKDEDDGNENVLFLDDHCSELLEIFTEIPVLLFGIINSQEDNSEIIAKYFFKASSIFLYYTPYLDNIASSMSDLSSAIIDNKSAFLEILSMHDDSIIMLFDAVSKDIENYVQRFQVESLAMRNAHHIHEPTALSIKQIITLFKSDEVDYGELEFF